MENIVNNMNNMNNSEKKNKPNICSVDEYMNNILIKIEKMMPVAKKTGKISDDNIDKLIAMLIKVKNRK